MAPKMALRRLLPHFRGIRSSSSKVPHSVDARSVTPSIQETTNRFHASSAFTSNIAKVPELYGPFRLDLTPSLSKFAGVTPGVYKTKVVVYSDDVKNTGDSLAEDISRTVQQPNDNGFLATLRYSCDLANAAFSASTSNHCAFITQIAQTTCVGAASKFHWEILGVLPRQDLQSSTKDDPSFTLWIKTMVDRGAATIGPRTDLSGKVVPPLTRDLGIKLRFRTNALAFTAPRGGSADEPTHSVDDFVRELLNSLWHSLRGRQFTSIVSWNEAVVLHLKDSFRRSKFDKYFELEDVRVNRKEFLSNKSLLQWVHEPPCLKEDLHGSSFSQGFESRVLNMQRMRSSGGVENKAAPMASARKVSNETVRTVINPYTLDISVASNAQANFTPSIIASRIEQDLARSTARDLPTMLDSFLAVLQNLPKDIADPMTVRISLDAPTLSRGHASTSLLPADSVEFQKSAASDSVKVSIRTDLQRSFQLHFNSEGWEARQIQVKGILFQISPIDATAVDSLLGHSLSEQVGIEQETNNLATNAATIIQKVCEGVKFDDVTTVTGYLVEAVLRVVRPLTPGFVLDSVSMEVVIGDDSVTLTKTVSKADLEARILAPKAYIPPLDHVELPSGYQATVRHSFTSRRSETMVKAGFKNLSFQLLSHPVIDYEPANIHRQFSKAIDMIKYALKASPNFDCYTLQAIVCDTLKKFPGGEGVAVKLTAPGLSRPAEMLVPTLCNITVFSDGETAILLEPFVLASLTYDRRSGCESKSGHAVVEIILKGTPNQQINGRINARQQMAFLNKVLASKCNAHFDGNAMVHSQLAAEKVAEIVLEARSEFEDHFAINTVAVRMKMYLNEQAQTGPAGNYEAQYEAERSLSSPAANIDHTRVAKSSAGASVCKEAVAVEALLQELDSTLLSITSTSSDDALASGEIARPVQLDSKANKRGQMQRGVVVALGSNVGNRVEEIEKACRAIDADPDMRIVDTSFLYETKPMYVEDQERFVNGACEIETSLTPIELLDRLQAIEQGHGRVKLIDKGPRNIDLDIAIFRDEIVETERLTVPHMLMHEREFVLRPIMDLRSVQQWINPRSNESIHAMLNRIVQPDPTDKDSTEPMHVVTPLTTRAMMHPMDPCRKTLVMSILNTTPDSFSDGASNTLDPLSLRETAAAHIAAGATIIDVGGQSSRPSAPDVTAEEEINRVLPAIAAIKSLPEAEGIAISVDTYRAAVAEAAVNAGAHIVNDISAGALDPHMLSTVARLGCTYIMMHMRGSPATMQSPENCTYGCLDHEIIDELDDRVTLAIKAGVRKWRIFLDPGIGFAKTQDQNLQLLRRPLFRRNAPSTSGRPRGSARNLSRMPQLLGCSRKGFIGNITGVTEPKDRIFGTAAAVTASIRTGADIVRVHDVQEMAQTAKMADAIYRHKRSSF